MYTKFKACTACHRKILDDDICCKYCGEVYLKNANKVRKKSKVRPLNSLRLGSLVVIVNVMIFSLFMWGVVKLFSAIGDFFHF